MSGDPEEETKIADTTAALDDLTFDPSVKKKKKSSKKTTTEDDASDVLSGLKKKKKSKSTAQALADLEEPTPAALSEAKEEDVITNTESPDQGGDEGGDFDFGAKKKKKKKKAVATGVGGEDFDQQLEEAGIVSTEQREEKEKQELLSGELATSLPASSTRDFTYTELLARFFTILRENNPELAGQASTKYKIPPPQAMREGNKKTIFANLKEISDRMHRPYEHVMQFLFAELGTSGSVDGSNRLVIKGRFQQKQLENVLRRYIMDYVTCKTCKNANTRLVKENRLTFIECQSCGSRRSVSGIKTGFQAHIGRRRKMAA